jgi:type II secretory pathway component GspD/PulD (secretin)
MASSQSFKGFGSKLVSARLLVAALAACGVLTGQVAHAADAPVATSAPAASEMKYKFFAQDGELASLIATYAKISGRKFIVDPAVRGKVGIYLPGDVTVEEAYNILVESLAINGFTVIEQGDTIVIKSARNAQRDMIPTYTKLPPPKPNRMVTMIFVPKYISVDDVNKRLRILPSKDGEMTPFEPSNMLIVSDFAANINRMAEIINQIDVPANAKWKQKPGPKELAPKTAPKPKILEKESPDA